MNRFVSCLLIIVLICGCATHYEKGRKHLNRANIASKGGRLGRALKEYDRVLRVLEEGPPSPQKYLLQASAYYQVDSIKIKELWKKLDESARKDCPHISKIINDVTLEKADFLRLAFGKLSHAHELLKESVLPGEESWLIIAKNVIIGDLLKRLGDQAPKQSGINIKGVVPDSFFSSINKYANYEMAKVFYLDAWIKNIVFVNTYPPIKINWLTQLPQKRLKGICRSLSSISEELGYLNINESFRELFKKKSDDYSTLTQRIDMISFPVSSELILSEDKLAELTGIQREPQYLVFDSAYQLKEARIKLSSAIEEILAKKADLTRYFLDGLKHLALSRMLGNLRDLSERKIIDSLTEDIYLHLYRAQDDKE